MFLRFQGQVPNLGTASQLGIFQLAFKLRDTFDVPDYIFNELQHHINWLNVNLKAPAILDEGKNYRAICWFTPAAKEPMGHIWPIKAILDDYGYSIDVVTTNDPGTVIYQDGWQVAAIPRRRRTTRIKRFHRTRRGFM
jgi:hypothetical protein